MPRPMLASLVLLSALLGLSTAAVPGIGRRETNAQRLAAGLPPLRPRHLYGKGTRTGSAPRQLPSSSPSSTEWVTITVLDGVTGLQAGYLNRDTLSEDTPGVYEVARASTAEGWTTPREVRFPAPGPYEQPGGDWLGVEHFLAAFMDKEPTIGPGDSNWLTFLDSAESGGPPGTPAVRSTSYLSTSVWVVEPRTGALSAYWTNPNGSSARAYVVLCEYGNLFLTGDLVLGIAQLAQDTGGLACWPVDLRMTATTAPDA